MKLILNTHKTMKDVVILRAVKGNSTVVMNWSNYDNDSVLKSDHNPYIENKVRDVIKIYIKVFKTNFQMPHLYCLTKIHKNPRRINCQGHQAERK